MKAVYIPVRGQQKAISLMTFLFFAAILLLFVFASSALARGVSVDKADASELSGNYTVIGYGCEAASEAPSLAILKKEGTPYDFEVSTQPAFFWGSLTETGTRQITGVPAVQALARAEKFVKCNPDVIDTEINKITDAEGRVLAYEVRPLYSPLRYGNAGLFSTSYRIEENEILASVGVNPLATTNEWGGG
jgi:hypothetical protein